MLPSFDNFTWNIDESLAKTKILNTCCGFVFVLRQGLLQSKLASDYVTEEESLPRVAGVPRQPSPL